MNLVVILIAIVAISVFGSPFSSPNPQFNYTYQRFVVTWPQTFCQTKTCRFGYSSWDKKSFVVHGLWPSSNDPGFVKQMMIGDDTCKSKQQFDATPLSSILSELTRIMPGLAKAPKSFWKYEYDKHGSCKVFLQKLRGSKSSQIELMNIYRHTVGNFQPKSSTFAGTNELAKALGINPSFISVTTENNGDIVQIHFCMASTNMNARGRPTFIACPGGKRPSSNLNLPGLSLSRHQHQHSNWQNVQNQLHFSVANNMQQKA